MVQKTRLGPPKSHSTLTEIVNDLPQPVVELLPDLERTAGNHIAKKQPATAKNVEAVLAYCGINVRWNMMAKVAECLIPVASQDEPMMFTNAEQQAVLENIMFYANIKDSMPIHRAVEALSMNNPYHPAEDWILSRRWLKKKNWFKILMEQGLSYANEEERRMARIYFNRWFLQGIEAARGWHYRRVQKALVLLLIGKQGIGKTSLLLSMAPEGMVREGVSLHLGAMNARDSIHSALTSWIVELGELETTFSKSDHGALKNFLSRTVDVYRRPYARGDDSFERVNMYGATVNYNAVMQDETGTRRYMPCILESIHVPPEFDWQQLWAQKNYEWEHGAQWWLTEEEEKLRIGREEKFMASDEVDDSLSEFFDPLWNNPNVKWRAVTFTMLSNLCGFKPTRTNSPKVQTWLESRGHARSAKIGDLRKCWWLPVPDLEVDAVRARHKTARERKTRLKE